MRCALPKAPVRNWCIFHFGSSPPGDPCPGCALSGRGVRQLPSRRTVWLALGPTQSQSVFSPGRQDVTSQLTRGWHEGCSRASEGGDECVDVSGVATATRTHVHGAGTTRPRTQQAPRPRAAPGDRKMGAVAPGATSLGCSATYSVAFGSRWTSLSLSMLANTIGVAVAPPPQGCPKEQARHGPEDTCFVQTLGSRWFSHFLYL